MNTIPETISISIRRLRKERGWTQQRLANEMKAIGLPWARITVAESEARGRRRVTPEELLALALVFGVPISWTLSPEDGRDIMIGEVAFSAESVQALCIGGQLSDRDRAVQRSQQIANEIVEIERSIADLEQQRQAKEAEREKILPLT